MKSKACSFVLVILFFMGSMASAYACSVHFTVINKSNIDLAISIAGPLRMSHRSTIKAEEKGNPFTYHAEDGIISCHGGYAMEVQPGDSFSCDTSLTRINAPSDSTWTFTINKPEEGAKRSCGKISVVQDS